MAYPPKRKFSIVWLKVPTNELVVKKSTYQKNQRRFFFVGTLRT